MRRLQLYELEHAVAQDGHVTWQGLAPVWVSLRVLRNRVVMSRGEVQAQLTHRAQLRRHDLLRVGMRLRRGEASFIIHQVAPLGRREGWLTCLCEAHEPLLKQQAIG